MLRRFIPFIPAHGVPAAAYLSGCLSANFRRYLSLMKSTVFFGLNEIETASKHYYCKVSTDVNTMPRLELFFTRKPAIWTSCACLQKRSAQVWFLAKGEGFLRRTRLYVRKAHVQGPSLRSLSIVSFRYAAVLNKTKQVEFFRHY